jgi:hypothetical protein
MSGAGKVPGGRRGAAARRPCGRMAVSRTGACRVIAGPEGELYAEARSAASLAVPGSGEADRRSTRS